MSVRLLVSKQGVCVPFGLAPAKVEDGARTVCIDSKKCFLIPNCRDSDELMLQPPLAVELSVDELAEIVAGMDAIAPVATDVAKKEENKRNEDFALSAALRSRDGNLWQFAAIADGVSNRTFWAERASRLACFVAFQTIRQAVVAEDFGTTNIETVIVNITEKMKTSIASVLRRDHAIISSVCAYPPEWDPDLYDRLSKRQELWYNSTLVTVVLGPETGFAFWCGDGGLWIERKENDGKRPIARPLYSGESSTVENVINMEPGVIEIEPRIINISKETKEIRVILSSDGVDRTIFHLNKATEGEDIYTRLAEAGNSVQMHFALLKIMREDSAEPDNASVALLAAPVEKAKIIAYDGKILEVKRQSERVEREQDGWCTLVTPAQRPPRIGACLTVFYFNRKCAPRCWPVKQPAKSAGRPPGAAKRGNATAIHYAKRKRRPF